MDAPMTPGMWAARVRQSRRYGSTYIPVASRGGLTVGEIAFTWTFYGRSQQGGGHKHKAYARYSITGLKVPSAALAKL